MAHQLKVYMLFGELTGGLHGQNRIGGNAIADIIIYGRQAVRNQQNLPLLKNN
ncbi:hypothetical protein OLM08_14925 [Enterococcus faecalis]|nr:hypothetical protein OLM08_14925 [Enterococcus faecalis]